MLRSLHEADPPIGGRVGAALTLLEVLEEWARVRPEETIYSFLDSVGQEAASLRFGELDRRARAVAATLQERGGAGVKAGAALLLFPPGLDFIVAFLGCLSLASSPFRPIRRGPTAAFPAPVIARDAARASSSRPGRRRGAEAAASGP